MPRTPEERALRKAAQKAKNDAQRDRAMTLISATEMKEGEEVYVSQIREHPHLLSCLENEVRIKDLEDQVDITYLTALLTGFDDRLKRIEKELGIDP